MEIKEIEKTEVLKGGEFLVKETNANDVFIREEFGEEQIMDGKIIVIRQKIKALKFKIMMVDKG